MWRVILEIIASAFKYLSNKQLLDAGANEEKLKQVEVENEAIADTKQEIKRNQALSDTDLANEYELHRQKRIKMRLGKRDSSA